MAVHQGQRGLGHQARTGWAAQGDGGADTTPDPFALGDAGACAPGATYESAAITVGGIDAPAALSVTGGDYAINGGGWASAATTVGAGDVVKVRGVASASLATALDVGLQIGGVADTFTITTVAHAETAALIGRFAADPGATRRGLIDALIGALKAAGLWAKIDVLHVYAAHDGQAAALNWVSTSYAASPQASPTFTADRGYAGDGSGTFINTGLANNATGVNWQAASALATFGVGVNVAGTVGANNHVFGLNGGAASVRFNPYNGTGAQGRFLATSDQSFTNGAGRVGRYLVTRDAGGQAGYRNGALMSTAAPGTPSVNGAGLALLRSNTTFSDSRVSFAMIGGGAAIWTATEAANFDAAMDAYLAAVGAN
ncbi:MAG: hypothetical protein JNL41_10805 [Phenylobacterium sp.]|uniref:hypothetical protein n=1 Tax=Phenylobacterium sp. TaxID=1871053 RepID=UPI001A6179C2|nr:hypothetical protein [Phenylobacterium sp.]MBL8554758.1 hypothetical protein [Phenylobacterium sp.]